MKPRSAGHLHVRRQMRPCPNCGFHQPLGNVLRQAYLKGPPAPPFLCGGCGADIHFRWGLRWLVLIAEVAIIMAFLYAIPTLPTGLLKEYPFLFMASLVALLELCLLAFAPLSAVVIELTGGKAAQQSPPANTSSARNDV